MLRRIVFTLGLLIAGLSVRAEYFVIKSMDVQIRIDGSGYFEVMEDIVVEFSTDRHGIFRDIPTKNMVNGETVRIKVYDIRVDNWPKEVSTNDGVKRIRIGDPDRYVNGRQRYVIRYKVKNAFLFLDDHTEFYWNVVGTEWPVPIESSTYRIELPEGVTLTADDFGAFSGALGERGSDVEIDYSDGVLSGRATRGFNPGEGYSVAIRLPVESIYRPTEAEKFMNRYASAGIPLAIMAFLLNIFVRKGKNERVVDMVHYYPPDDFSPAEAGAFIDDKIDNRDIIALIPHWAGQGYLRMEEIKEKKLIIFSDRDFEFVKLKDLPDGRPDYEYTVFDGLFADGDKVRMSDLKNKFYTTMGSARKKIKKDLMKRRLYTEDSVKWRNWFIAFGILGVFFVVPLIALEQYLAGVLCIPLAVMAFVIYHYMLKRNAAGQEVYQKLNGFKMFVDKAEQPRLERLLAEDATYFEKTLPYAVAFGMTKKWAQKFEGLFTEPPSWYTSYYYGAHHTATFHDFAENFNTGIREVQSVFTSQPGGSGGGGSGGSSGGGFGGGGGGSW